ncbi:hypothetical protein [Flavobacterium caeni]|uniref:Uncharacterized protein n=1 Tax=Flavobacterium caeni TaxID=490189 RepID=A0A1G5JUK5_9FLAO|nr:hypothetical protein [Flavobacterium caeni]SCY91359.1 hypothetical protein SAMN02927903_02872 [Flavobacterium caeni]
MATSSFFEKWNRVCNHRVLIGMSIVLGAIYLAKKGYQFGQWLQLQF